MTELARNLSAYMNGIQIEPAWTTKPADLDKRATIWNQNTKPEPKQPWFEFQKPDQNQHQPPSSFQSVATKTRRRRIKPRERRSLEGEEQK